MGRVATIGGQVVSTTIRVWVVLGFRVRWLLGLGNLGLIRDLGLLGLGI